MRAQTIQGSHRDYTIFHLWYSESHVEDRYIADQYRPVPDKSTENPGVHVAPLSQLKYRNYTTLKHDCQ